MNSTIVLALFIFGLFVTASLIIYFVPVIYKRRDWARRDRARRIK